MSIEKKCGREKKPERAESIKSAAVRYENETFEAPTHAQALEMIFQKYPDRDGVELLDECENGFVTASGAFVNRKEAQKIAEAAQQLNEREKAEPRDLGSDELK